jgi:hypothetical protein
MDWNIFVLKEMVYGQAVMKHDQSCQKRNSADRSYKESAVVDGYVVRQPKAYPVYDHTYKENVEAVREALKAYPGCIL